MSKRQELTKYSPSHMRRREKERERDRKKRQSERKRDATPGPFRPRLSLPTLKATFHHGDNKETRLHLRRIDRKWKKCEVGAKKGEKKDLPQ